MRRWNFGDVVVATRVPRALVVAAEDAQVSPDAVDGETPRVATGNWAAAAARQDGDGALDVVVVVFGGLGGGVDARARGRRRRSRRSLETFCPERR